MIWDIDRPRGFRPSLSVSLPILGERSYAQPIGRRIGFGLLRAPSSREAALVCSTGTASKAQSTGPTTNGPLAQNWERGWGEGEKACRTNLPQKRLLPKRNERGLAWA
jgi:hypothetical protein